MAGRRAENFDYLVTADLPNRFTSLSGAPTVSAGNGRNGTASLRCTSMAQGWDLTFDAQATWVVGFSWNYDSLGGNKDLLAFLDTAVSHLTWRIKTDGTIEVRRGNNAGTLLATSTSILSGGATYYLEFYVTIDDSVGVAKLRVNGVLDATLNFSGDTRNAGNSMANVIRYQSVNASTTTNQDDLYICDGTVGDADNPNNDFLGDGRVEAVLPGGAGNYAQFTPSAGANWQNVDDAAPDGNTTYNASSTVGNIDTFAMANLVTPAGSIAFVELINYADKTTAGIANLAPLWRIAATDYVGADDAMGTDYTYQSDQLYDVSPATGVAFTITEFNAAEIGYKKTA